MKKLRIYLLCVSFLLTAISCRKDVLNIEPDTLFLAEGVFDDENLTRAYVADLYNRMPLSAFEHGNTADGSDDCTRASGQKASPEGPADVWDYEYIRDCNKFLENLEGSTIKESLVKQFEGEVRFLRAFLYFEMEKRYGAVPLVDVVLDPYSPVDDKYTLRSSEEKIADFIDNELAIAVTLLPDQNIPTGRINKWTAYAFKARTALWAASIAKYSDVQLDGLLGIPVTRADEFFKKASDAAKAVIESGKYSLYNKIPGNKAENYRNIFVDEGNSEVIFERIYDGVNIGHGWDLWNAPPSIAGRGGLVDPTLGFILSFENVDGSEDQPLFGTDHLYEDGAEPFLGKDPRLFSTVFFQGDPWAGITVQTYEATDPSPVPDSTSIRFSYLDYYEGRPLSGWDSRHGPTPSEATTSGFLIKKYIDGTRTFVPENQSTTNWIIMRLAEMYLTRAEAEFELGHPDVAVVSLNKTRERAGITSLDVNSITIDKIRNERRSELSFEDQRFWDLRRWRIAVDVLTAAPMQGLMIIFHEASGKYYFMPMDAENGTRSFADKYYYNKIGSSRINNNPKLVENPGHS